MVDFSQLLHEQLAAIEPYAPPFADRSAVNLALNEHPLPPPPAVQALLAEAESDGLSPEGRAMLLTTAEALAPDGLVEAISDPTLPFALGVQWHAEYDPQTNPVNGTLFKAFGEAVSRYQAEH